MSLGVTTSIRIKPHLRQELESVSHDLGHGINWVIEKAVEEFLKRNQREHLIQQVIKDIAFLQSTNCKTDAEEEAFWEAAFDDSDWV